MEQFQFTIQQEQQGIRLDKILAERFPEISRTMAQQMLEQGYVLLNGNTVLKNYKVRVGDAVVGSFLPAESLDAIPQNIPVDIVYEDDSLLVVNKPKGMVVHPAPGNPDNTLVNALL